MPFISYAQNYEDVILWRALRDVEQGFYVDVGAADPQEYSVTNAFYERGWSGINIEPLDEYYRKLTKARPRDTNIHAAVGHEAGLRTLYAFAGTGLSTLDPEIAARQQASGYQALETLVPVLTLKAILEDYAASAIHFLKIDVEGAEVEVLKGSDLNSVRPWILVIEGTVPSSQVSTRDHWEHLIIDYGYSFAYFDGLNCFYLADEMANLKERLSVPPNVFDQFVSWPEWSNQQRAASLQKELIDIRAHADWLKSVCSDATKRAKSLETEAVNQCNALQAEQAQVNSLSGRIHQLNNALQAEQAHKNFLSGRVHQLEVQLAAPSIDRAMGRFVRRIREAGDRATGGGMRALANRVAEASVRRCSSFAVRHPRLAVLGLQALKPFPRMREQFSAHAAIRVTVIPRIEKAEVTINLVPYQRHRLEVPLSGRNGENVIRFETNADGVKGSNDSRDLFFNVRILKQDAGHPIGTIRPLGGFSSIEGDGDYLHVWAIERRADLKVVDLSPEIDSISYVFELSTLNPRSITITRPPIAASKSLSPQDAAIIATIPASARSTYLNLQTAVSQNSDWIET